MWIRIIIFLFVLVDGVTTLARATGGSGQKHMSESNYPQVWRRRHNGSPSHRGLWLYYYPPADQSHCKLRIRGTQSICDPPCCHPEPLHEELEGVAHEVEDDGSGGGAFFGTIARMAATAACAFAGRAAPAVAARPDTNFITFGYLTKAI